VIGTGGAMALLPTARRQRYTELTLVRTDRDATERRITELYTKAAELLGSGQVSVRMAGLYALERLAHRRASPINCRCNTGTAWNPTDPRRGASAGLLPGGVSARSRQLHGCPVHRRGLLRGPPVCQRVDFGHARVASTAVSNSVWPPGWMTRLAKPERGKTPPSCT
jgi:hypothetical protein